MRPVNTFFFFSGKTTSKLGSMTLFTYLNIILLHYFQFSVFHNKRYPNTHFFSFFLLLRFSSSASSFFFFFFISKKKKKKFSLSPPLFLYQISVLFKFEKNLSTKLPWLNTLTLSLSRRRQAWVLG